MRISLIAVGERMPDWAAAGWREYARRLRGPCRLDLVEIPAARRRRGADLPRLAQAEGERLLAAVPRDATLIALEREGVSQSTESLAQAMVGWRAGNGVAAFLVGGPEGLAPLCLARADAVWSLSGMTFAHPLVRVMLAEQVYRAWSIIAGLPYHRGAGMSPGVLSHK